MEILQNLSLILALLFAACCGYQLIYVLLPFLIRRCPQRRAEPHSFAVLICARNEEAVIGELIDSLHGQTYDQRLLQIFVMADNCTDGTAPAARAAGAAVYERFDRVHVGKGYALEALLERIAADYSNGFDGYFVFDADNLLAPDYIERMNEVFSGGHEIVTGYRSSKNFGGSWVSAGHSLWFLRESAFLNHPRSLIGSSCAISGTGFLFSRRVLDEQGGWPFHLLTEDLQFTAHHVLSGRRVGYAPDAILYDEQPTTLTQSMRQRIRWARGSLQVIRRYGRRLALGAAGGSFSCFDMLMAAFPAVVFNLSSILCNAALTVAGLFEGLGIRAFVPALTSLGMMTGGFFLMGAVTMLSEWKRIDLPAAKKLLYMLTFPLFMLTYVPVSLVSLLPCRIEWKPIIHHSVRNCNPPCAKRQNAL